jgi:flagellar basal-body rod protein FlgB
MFETAPTTEILARAIDVCALKQAVYSANIANANVAGYKRLEVMFDAQAMRTEASVQGGLQGALQTNQQAEVVSAGTAVKLDEEMALMARNALRYQTLLDAYERSTSLMKLAVHEGRGA